MILGSEQVQAFHEPVQAAFRRNIAAYLRRHLPRQTAGFPEPELDGKIIEWQARAARHGVVTERAIAKWCFLSLVTSDTFDEFPEIREYLERPAPDPPVKVDTLMDALYVRMRQAEQGA